MKVKKIKITNLPFQVISPSKFAGIIQVGSIKLLILMHFDVFQWHEKTNLEAASNLILDFGVNLPRFPLAASTL
ncbi:hypothetical protein [uncultured Cohaesibacter sp.]|uniref:hypothetical protein n=1 Tax=uncultured Cohaesibacter sp. TaxID=1002546 RepID=UPI0029C889C2|nr:hypothetical protein [uncultured Cohaesibacter sp.]